MAKIVLPDASNGNSGTQRINDNFRKVAEALNDKVLFRDNPPGEPNEMNNDLDMNSNRVYNLPIPVLDHEAAPWGEVKGGVPAAKEWAEVSRQWSEVSREWSEESRDWSEVSREWAEESQGHAEDAEQQADRAEQEADRAESEADRAQDIADSIPNVVEGATLIVERFSGDGVTTSFTLDEAPGSENNTQVYITGVYQQKDTYDVVGDVLTFSEAPPTGTDNIEVVIAPSIAIGTTNAGSVTFTQSGSGSVERNMRDKAREILSVKDFGAVGDGIVNDQAAIMYAISEAIEIGAVLNWPAGTYISTDNFPGFHSVHHVGSGKISRSGDIFHITPVGSQTNILYTGAGGSSLNDGLSATEVRTVRGCRDALYAFGDKVQNGQWRMQFVPGTCTESGQAFYDMPTFAKPLQVWGILDGGVRTAIWDGTTSTQAYAFRADKGNVALNVDFRYMKFTNWHLNGSTNSGAICCWFQVNVTTFQNEFDNCGVAIWCRGGRSQHYGDIINNCDWGIGLQYCHSAIVGSSPADNQVYISNCDIGVFLGRQSIAHIDYTHFSNSRIDVLAAQKSRAATDHSTYTGWTENSIRLESDSIHEQNGSVWDPASITDATPIYHLGNGSAVPDQYFGPLPYRTQHYAPNTAFAVSNNTSRILLSGQSGFGSPLRMRKQMLFNNGTLQVKVEMVMGFNTSTGTRIITLSGPGNAPAYDLVSIVVPAEVGTAKITFEINFMSGLARAIAKVESNNSAMNTMSFNIISNTTLSTIRDKTQDIAAWRLYSQMASSTDSMNMQFLSTTVTG